ncbi:MAG: hypothetical protein PVI86_16610, partial [Phycisphaerae bacterium]
MCRRPMHLVLSPIVLLLPQLSATADPYEGVVTGTVFWTSANATDIEIGDAATFTYLFDTSTADERPEDQRWGYYDLLSMTGEIGPLTFTFT